MSTFNPVARRRKKHIETLTKGYRVLPRPKRCKFCGGMSRYWVKRMDGCFGCSVMANRTTGVRQ